jgi:hypothetical protein
MQRRKVVTHLFRCFIILPAIILQNFLTTDGHGWIRIFLTQRRQGSKDAKVGAQGTVAPHRYLSLVFYHSASNHSARLFNHGWTRMDTDHF